MLMGSLLPMATYCQVAPKLVLADQSVRAINLDKDVLATIISQNWRNEDWSEVFRIYTWHAHKNQIPQPLAGHYHVDGVVVYFTPLFPFAAGETYFGELDYGRLWKKSGGLPVGNKSYENRENIELVFSIPDSIVPRTFVEAIYPTSDTLPANLLRMYVYFSAPMSMGEAYEHIQLKDEIGNIVGKAFLIVDQELWDTERRRFTLLFDPGRIKRGIQSNIDLGMPLQSGHSYSLVINSAWQDEHGNSLLSNYEKKMVVGDARREKLSKQNWAITEPEASSRNPLVVRFDKPLDHTLALKYIVVADSFSNIIVGKTEMKDDRTWTFYPNSPWNAGNYSLQISPYLEDPAGNNFNNPFDVDLSVAKRVNSEEPVIIPFIVRQEMN
jgi:hypothetical protein